MNITPVQQNRIVAAMILLLLGSSLLHSRWARLISQPPRYLLTMLVSPLTRPLHALGSALRSQKEAPPEFGSDVIKLTHLLKAAQAQSANLKIQLHEAQDTISTLTRMKGYMSFDGTSLLPARVTQSTADPTHPTLTIDIGQRDGVHPGFVVASEFNLVGRVTFVGNRQATVSLLMKPRRHLQVAIMPKLAGAVKLPGQETNVMARVSENGTLLTAVVPATSQIRPGYLTRLLPSRPGQMAQAGSGNATEASWPREAWGLVVGRVTKVVPDPNDPISRKQIEIRPLNWHPHLTEVVVIAPQAPKQQFSTNQVPTLAGQQGSY
jgi:cell shape-determining protein MreC